ncbi:hypothetical protein Pmani_021413 [Petrolisthes manimaculis]|uniref:Uncharacterized protein n=1 Tax=Petrolisthes manimaculis TaxID=1843537 RepID=A0AAE1PGI2_9EUCA|nr:hypothetical protein Pmani_021413 [Petrolisthes manimaculis]
MFAIIILELQEETKDSQDRLRNTESELDDKDSLIPEQDATTDTTTEDTATEDTATEDTATEDTATEDEAVLPHHTSPILVPVPSTSSSYETNPHSPIPFPDESNQESPIPATLSDEEMNDVCEQQLTWATITGLIKPMSSVGS